MVADLSGGTSAATTASEESPDEMVADFRPAETENTGGSETPVQPISKPAEGPDWMRGLLGANEDPTGYTALARTTMPEEAGNIPGMLNAAAAGGVHGTVMGLERRVPGVREWSVEAERAEPNAFMAGDVLQNFNPYSPANLAGGITRLIPAATKWGMAGRGLADVVTQTGIGAADTAARKYGDAGGGSNPEYGYTDALKDTNPMEVALDAALSTPGAAIGALAAHGAARQATPEARELRQTDYQNERLRSGGYDDQAIDELRKQPKKFGDVLSEIERLAEARGGSYTVPQMARDVRGSLAEHDVAKKAAIEAYAQAGATIDPMDVHDKIRADARAAKEGAAHGTSLDSRYVAGADAVAQEYADSPRPMRPWPLAPDQMPAMEVPPALPPPPLPPGPDPVGALAELGASDAARAHPPGFADLAAADEAAGAARPTDISPHELQVAAPGDLPPPPLPPGPTDPDPVGALAAEGAFRSAEPGSRDRLMAAQHNAKWLASQPPRAPAPDVPAPVSYADNSGFLAAAAARRPPAPPPYDVPPPAAPARAPFGMEAPLPPDQAALAQPREPQPVPNTFDSFGMGSYVPPEPRDPGPARVPFNAYVSELNTAGEGISPEFAKPEDAYQRERYAAVDHAMDLGAERASPEMAAQWAGAKEQQGVLNLIKDQASGARHDPKPFMSMGGGGGGALGGALGAAGSTAGYALGGMAGLGVALPALGLGAGMAANNWYQPRKHSISANWLSGDTADRMERLSKVGQAPTGSMVSSFGDMLREPPPAAEPETGPQSSNGLPAGMRLGRDTTSSMKANPDAFMPWQDDYNKDRTDDDRAATTERLARTNPDFYDNVYEKLIQRSNA